MGFTASAFPPVSPPPRCLLPNPVLLDGDRGERCRYKVVRFRPVFAVISFMENFLSRSRERFRVLHQLGEPAVDLREGWQRELCPDGAQV